MQLGRVTFPDVQGERHYMIPFFKKTGLPQPVKQWQRTVDQMLDGIDLDTPMFLMVDQKFVPAGTTLRRPGAHVDGHWVPAIHAHGGSGHSGGGGGNIHSPGHRGPAMDENDILDSIIKKTPIKKVPLRYPKKRKPKTKDASSAMGRWVLDAQGYDEGLILASNVAGCESFGIKAPFGVRGDCSHIDTTSLDREILVDGRAYGIDAFDLHASTPMQRDVYRTLVRLNVPGLSF